MDDTPEPEPIAPAAAAEVPQAPEGGWKADRKGNLYVKAQGRKGTVYRAGDAETVAEALARDATPRDQRPRKSKAGSKPPPPSKDDLRELEELLAEALRSPAVPCAFAGDAWAADHFTNAGPALARNLVLASEHNPWLRKKLENASSGGDMMVQMMVMLSLGGAIAMYAVPPIVYWLNLPVPDKGREMFGIPKRREHEPARPPAPDPIAAAA